MKTYLITTGALFGLMTAIHIWRTIDEWHPPVTPGFALGMIVIIALPAALCWWALHLLRKMSRK